MNSQQTPKLNSSEQSPSFDDVSKLFSLPLSEAADILGVSAAVLKKICTDNGLERWPHRKYLAGKSIEEIMKAASRDKNKALANSNNMTTPGSQVKEKGFRSLQEISKPNVQQQPGNRSVFTLRAHQELLTPNYAFESISGLDEFKYGFPSDGLSVSGNKWWGESGGTASDNDKSEDDESKSSVNDDSAKVEGQIEGAESSDDGTQQIGALSGIRKRALEEGRETLKFGFWKELGAEKVAKKEKLLLTRIFG